MTPRERIAVALTAAGGAHVSAAAYGYGGWRLCALTNGVLLLGAGLLLGIEPEPEMDGELAAVGDFPAGAGR